MEKNKHIWYKLHMNDFFSFVVGLVIAFVVFVVLAINHQDNCLNNIYQCANNNNYKDCKFHIDVLRKRCIENDATACVLLYNTTTDQLEKESTQKRIKQLIQPILNN